MRGSIALRGHPSIPATDDFKEITHTNITNGMKRPLNNAYFWFGGWRKWVKDELAAGDGEDACLMQP